VLPVAKAVAPAEDFVEDRLVRVAHATEGNTGRRVLLGGWLPRFCAHGALSMSRTPVLGGRTLEGIWLQRPRPVRGAPG
jgi:hypothetical protein